MPPSILHRISSALRLALTLGTASAVAIACASGPFPLRDSGDYATSARDIEGVCSSWAHQGRRTRPIGRRPQHRCQFPYTIPDVASAAPPSAPEIERRVSDRPKPAAPRPQISVATVLFAFDSAQLRPEDRARLRNAAGLLRENSDRAVRIDGYADATGPEAYNLGLSLRRARAAEAYLIGQDISDDRLTVIGHGEADPVASNATREGRRQNRRVEIDVP